MKHSRLALIFLVCIALVIPVLGWSADDESGKTSKTDKDLEEKVEKAVQDATKKVADKLSDPEYWKPFREKRKNVVTKMPIMELPDVEWSVLGERMSVRDMRYLARDRLLISYQFDHIILVDTKKGEVLWRIEDDFWELEEMESRVFDIVMAFEDIIILRSDRDRKGQTMVVAVKATSGERIWSQVFKNKKKSFDVLPAPHNSTILIIERDKKKAKFRAYDLVKGTARWERSYKIKSKDAHPPKPLITNNGVWNFISGVEKLSMTDGKSEWQQKDIVLDGKSPSPMMDGENIVIVDANNKMHILNAATGDIAKSFDVDPSVRYMNIYPLEDRIYLRAAIEAKKTPTAHSLEAIDKSTGARLWNISGKEAFVSNLIEDSGRLYVSTPSTLFCLDRNSGKEIFKSPATQTGQTFPIQLRKFGNTIVYVGELVIAGYDMVTGKQVYLHGLTPLTQEVHLDALDNYIRHLQDRIGILKKGVWFSGGGSSIDYFTAQAQLAQNRSNQYRSQASDYYRSSQSSYNASAESDYWKSQQAAGSAEIESAYAGAMLQLGFFFKMKELGDNMRMNSARENQNEVKKLEFIRRSLNSAYNIAQDGEYVYRPHFEDGFSGVYVVHLPTGKAAFTPLSPDSRAYVKYGTWNDRGLWNVLDLERGRIYSHGFRISADKYQDKDMPEGMKNYGMFLNAVPVEIPK